MTFRPNVIAERLFSPPPGMAKQIQYSRWQPPSANDSYADRGDELRSGMFHDLVFDATFRESRLLSGSQYHLISESVHIKVETVRLLVGLGLTFATLFFGILCWERFVYRPTNRESTTGCSVVVEASIGSHTEKGTYSSFSGTIDYAKRGIPNTGNPLAVVTLCLGILALVACLVATALSVIGNFVIMVGCLSVVMGAISARKAILSLGEGLQLSEAGAFFGIIALVGGLTIAGLSSL